MRRLFAVCLLVLMSLQFSWAAVAAYCQHEVGISAQHLGHHVHQHADGNDDASPDTSRQSKGPHADCGFCHAGAQLTGPADLLLGVCEASTALQADHPGFLPDPPLPKPERPKWARRA